MNIGVEGEAFVAEPIDVPVREEEIEREDVPVTAEEAVPVATA